MLPKRTQIKTDNHHEKLPRHARDHAPASAATRPGSPGRFPNRPRTVARAVAAACALMLSTVAVANAAAPGIVVGAHGKVAGQGYGAWLRNSWQLALSNPPGASACQTMRVGNTTVAMLLGGYSGKPERHNCRVHAGNPIYINGLSAECSTVEKPPFHGTTASGLRRCARRNLKGVTNLSATVDGRVVGDYHTLISTSPVYTFHLPKRNLLGVSARSGRSAAYGEGVLLRGLTPGNHVVHVTGELAAFGYTEDVTYTLHVVP